MRRALGTPRWIGLVLLALWALHAWDKAERGVFSEMLWACHVATLCTAMGIMSGVAWLTTTSALFQASVGLPSYILDAIATQHTTVLSLLLHVLSPLAGAIAVRRVGWPRWVPLAGTGMYLAVLITSHVVTDPALNVNLAHAPWGPTANVFGNLWISWLFNLTVIVVLLTVAEAAARRWWLAQS